MYIMKRREAEVDIPGLEVDTNIFELSNQLRF